VSAGSWSIRRRLTTWLALSAVGQAVVIAAVGAWFIAQSVDRELKALMLEEFAELHLDFAESAGDREAFAKIAEEFAEEHTANQLAWRVWANDDVWGEFGEVALFEAMELQRAPLEETTAPRMGMYWRVEELTPALTVGLLIDGTPQVAMIRRFGVIALVVLGIVAAVVALCSGFIGRQVGTLLLQVAENARAVRDPREAHALEIANAPEEIREVADALTEMLNKIHKEKDRAQLMTSGLAHELRSPLQNLIGEAEVTLMRERSSAEYKKVLDGQLEELRDLGRVVDNLVMLCGPSESSAASGVERFDLGREADLRLRREYANAARQGVELEVRADGDLAMNGDREALLLAVRNLVGNAIEWSPRGGQVEVHMHGAPEAVHVTVDDAGPGVDESLRESIFEPFTRGPSSNGHRIGYGLGLALTRTAVEAHSGTVAVEDSPLGGARFRIDLPRAASQAS